MIRKATHYDVAQVAQQYQDLLLYEKMHGSTTNWKLGIYPTQDTAEQAYAAGTLYVLETCRGTAIRLDTWADNTPAAALYQKCGFRLTRSCPILLQGIIPEQQLFFERKLEDNHDH